MGGNASKELEQRVAASQATIDSLNEAVVLLKSNLEKKNIDVETYSKEITELAAQREAEKNTLEDELKQRDLTIYDLHTSNDKLAEQVLNLRSDIEAMRQEFKNDREKTQAWLRSLQHQNQDLLSTVGQQQHTITKQQTTLDKQHGQLSKQQDQLSIQQNQLSSQQQNMNQLINIFLQGQNRQMGSPNHVVVQPEHHDVLLTQVKWKINTDGLHETEDMGFHEY